MPGNTLERPDWRAFPAYMRRPVRAPICKTMRVLLCCAQMKRFVLIFLLVLVPLQHVFAAADAYCREEAGSTTTHFGHHEHASEFDADAGAKVDGDTKSKGEAGAECGVCHTACAFVLILPASLPALESPSGAHFAYQSDVSSLPPSLPERPNWTDLA